MARLVYEISGDLTGLAGAAEGAKGILNNLQLQADKLNIRLFGAETEADIQAIGGALTIVTGKINEYTTAAIQGSQAFKDQSAQAALDALSTKISVLTGNAQLFGDSIKNQTAQIAAYQQAINRILAQGFGPLDSRIVSLKGNVDRLTASIEAQKAAAKTFIDPFAKFQTTGSLIKDAESKVRNLSSALTNATSTRDIAQYNVRLVEAQRNLERLRGIGTQTGTALATIPASLTPAVAPGANLVRSLGSAFGVVRQLAYILPGIGIAGIFNLAFEGIAKAAEGLDLFTTKLDKSIDTLKTFNEVEKEADKAAGAQIAPLKALYEAATDVTKSMKDRIEAAKELKDADFDTFGNATNLAIVNGDLKKSYDELTASILKQAQAQAAVNKIGELSGKILDENYKQQKIKNAQTSETARLQADVAKGSFDNTATRNAQVGKSIMSNSSTIADDFAQGQQSKINQRAINATKESKRVAQIYQDEINALLSIATSSTKTSAALDRANKLLGANLENFSKVLATATKEGDLVQLKALQSALQTKLDSLAPNDAQKTTLRKKIQEVEDLIKNTYTVKPTKTASGKGNFESISNSLDDIYRKSKALGNESGLKNYTLEVQKIADTYEHLAQEIDQALKKGLDDPKNSAKQKQTLKDKALRDKQALIPASDKEFGDASIKEAERVATSIQRINDEFGVKSSQTREKELKSLDVLYDTELKKAEGNADIIKTLDAARIAGKQSIEDKYVQIVTDTYDKIKLITEQATNAIGDLEQSRTGRIVLQYDKLKTEAAKYYKELKVLQDGGSPKLKGVDIGAQQAQTNTLLDQAKTRQISIVLSVEFSKAIQSSISTFASDFYNSIVGLGKARQDIDNKYATELANAADQATKDQINRIKNLEEASTTSFGAIFGSLASKFNQTFSQSLLQSFTKSITENLGTSLITPNLKDLGKVDPAVSISNAGTTFAELVTQAGTAFAASTSGTAPALLGASDTLVTAGKETGSLVTDGGKSAQSGLSKGAAGIAAAASVIGGIVSGLGKPTNSATSALGGAISGAGEGALIGSVIPGVGTVAGAVIGGVAGLIGGLFSASSARDKEQQAILEQQLAEQKQQTDLLRASLAYTSSIVGRMTANGIVTNVSVGSQGQLVATVQGKDLAFILSRTANGR